MNAVSGENLSSVFLPTEVHAVSRTTPAAHLAMLRTKRGSCRTTVTCIWGVSDPLSERGTSTGGWQRGSLTPRCHLHRCRQPRGQRHGRHRAPPAHRSEIAHSQGHRPVDLYSTNVHAAAVSTESRAPGRGNTAPESVFPPVFVNRSPDSPQPGDGTRVCGWRVGLRLRGTLRALERQHPYARPAFVNRQERASLDVLTMRFECLGDDAHGALREQVLSAELDDARPMRRHRPRGLPRSRDRS